MLTRRQFLKGAFTFGSIAIIAPGALLPEETVDWSNPFILVNQLHRAIVA